MVVHGGLSPRSTCPGSLSPRNAGDGEMSTLRIKIGKVAGALNGMSEWTGPGGDTVGALVRDMAVQFEEMAQQVDGMYRTQAQQINELSVHLTQVQDQQSDLADVMGR